MSADTRTFIGYTIYLVGVLGCVLCGMMFVELFSPKVSSMTYFLVTIGGFILSVFMVMISSCFLVPTFDQVTEIDQRSPVLFLRPFDEDKSRTYDVIIAGETTVNIQGTSEEFLLRLNAIGPLVSIGEPNWQSRIGAYPYGAYRVFVEHQNWQQKVEELLGKSSLVVLTVGESAGIEWEIEAVKNKIDHTALLLYLPPRPTGALTKKGRAKKEKTIYDEFKTMIEKRFPIHLPDFQETIYIIGFKENGDPIFGQSTSKKKWWLTEMDRTAKAVSDQLQLILSVMRPNHDLSSYTIIGQYAMYTRYIIATLLFLCGLGLGWAWQDSNFHISGRLNMILHVGTTILVQLALVIGWVLIAKYFRRRWIWIIPFCMATSSLLTIVFTLVQTRMLPENDFFYTFLGLMSTMSSVVGIVSALFILVLGVWLHGKKFSKPE